MPKKDRHVLEAVGMSRIVIENGRIVSMTEPKINYCPLFRKYRDMETVTADQVRKNIEFRIRDFGMCTENRVVKADDYVTFGVSEILSDAICNGEIEAAVIAADGCGTAVIDDPCIVQGLGGRISGLIETSPLNVVLDAVGRNNVLDPENTPVDMVKGADLAHSRGYRKFAVTVCIPDDAEKIRSKYGDEVVLAAVHTSTVDHAGAKKYFENCDMITACASGPLRKEAEGRDLIVAGNKVQVYGVTKTGKNLIMDRLVACGKKPYAEGELKDEPHPMI